MVMVIFGDNVDDDGHDDKVDDADRDMMAENDEGDNTDDMFEIMVMVYTSFSRFVGTPNRRECCMLIAENRHTSRVLAWCTC
jgi:hypothetical protein